MIEPRKRTRGLLCSVLLMGVACSPALPPQELRTARNVMASAKTGPAGKAAPVELDDARIALREAEAVFDDQPESEAARHLAYVALRKTQLANATAARVMADERRQESLREREKIRNQRQQRTEAALNQTQAELARHRQELEEERARLGQTQSELERERAARAEAERQYAAAVESLKEIAKVKEESRGLVITLSGAVLFASGQSSLLPLARQKLDQVAQTLLENEGQGIVVEGHTDSRGSNRSNQELSLARAEAVRNYLVGRGVPAASTRAVGIGEERPIASNQTAEGRANNRRVEIIVQPAAS